MEWMFEYKAYVPKFKMARLERIDEFMKRVAAMGSRQKDTEEEEQESKGFFNTIGNLFIRSKSSKPVEEPREPMLSPEDQETMRAYEHQLEVLLTEDCMLCGNMLVEGVDIPFDSPEECAWTI